MPGHSPTRRQARRLAEEDSGQTLVLAALGMLLLAGFLGLAIDMGELRHARRGLQTQADAAALAAALELTACNGVSACATMQTAATNSLAENGVAGATLTTGCVTNSSSPATAMMLNNPPCLAGSADPNTGNTAFVEVVLSQAQTTHFAGVLGYRSVPVTVRAEAGAAGTSGSSGSSGKAASVLVP